jgi:hypothetical protein
MMTVDIEPRAIIGLVERATLTGPSGRKVVTARIDTGATKSSIDASLARELGYDAPVKLTRVRQAHGTLARGVVRITVLLAGKLVPEKFFTLADRRHMRYKVLIGQNVLKRGGFLIDPTKDGEKL